MRIIAPHCFMQSHSHNFNADLKTFKLSPIISPCPLTPCLFISPWCEVQLVESNLVQAAVFHQLPHEAQGSEVVNEEKM